LAKLITLFLGLMWLMPICTIIIHNPFYLVKFMLQLINKLFPILDTLYFLQLTNYNTKIFLTKAHYFYGRRNLQVRDKLVFTTKVKLILFVYVVLIFIAFLVLRFWAIVPILLTPYLIAIINFVLEKITLIREDRRLFGLKLNKNSKLETLMITGSQGKTTLKYMLYNAIKPFRKVQIVPDNINTTSGVINWLAKNLLHSTEFLIFETEPFYAGEMAKVIKAIQPKYRILTNLTDQHLMRFGSLQKLHAAYLESEQNSSGCILLSAQDLIQKNSLLYGWHSHTDGVGYSHTAQNGDTEAASTNHYLTNLSYIYKSSSQDKIDYTKTKSLPSFMADYLEICEEVLIGLNVPEKFQTWSEDWLKNLPGRRKNIVEMWGFQVIDDSYNISLESAQSSIQYALDYSHKEGKKLIVLTAGIPESSANPVDANVEFGLYLRKLINEDKINLILLESEFYPYIAKGVTRYQKSQNLLTLMPILQHYNALEYTILFLPELNDFYY
jgi:UDP-N-acetylmuramyl pentapeptide synthase